MKIGLINLLVCFLIVLVISPLAIKILRKFKFGQSILIYVEQHKTKSGTPTMGGIIFFISISVGYLIFVQKENKLATLALLSLLAFGVLGFLDDFIKIKFKQNEGLKPYQKIIGQLGISIIIAIFAYKSQLVGGEINIPFSDVSIDLGYFIIPLIIIFYIAVVNSVNLIDGLDGLCSGVTMIVISAFVVIMLILSSGFSGVYLSEINNIVLLSLGVVGGLLGFLCFNGYPARVFMGDTGSLALGGFVSSIFALTKNYLLVLIIGLAYVVTSLSVIIQVGVYKLKHKRVFKMAPLHHHFEQTYHETKVVLMYWILTIIISLLTIIIYL